MVIYGGKVRGRTKQTPTKRSRKMKRYVVSIAERVNEKASKSGVKFCFVGRTDNPEARIESFKDEKAEKGLRITDSVTKQVIFEEIRADKGSLKIIHESGWEHVKEFCDLDNMRKWEHWYKYELKAKDKVVKVERTIY